MTTLYYKELFPMTGTTKYFIDVIYNNFLNLDKQEGLKHTKDEIKRLLTSQSMVGFLVHDKDILVGYIVGEQINLNDGRLVFYITYIYTAKKYRNKGLGEKLVKYILQKVKKIGLSFVVLKCDGTNEKVCKFYSKRGFVPDPVLSSNGKHKVLVYYL